MTGQASGDGSRSWSRRGFMGGAVSLATLGTLAAAGCSSEPGGSAQPAPSARPASPTRSVSASPVVAGADPELLRRRYGLAPFAPAPVPPDVRPVTLSAGRPSVFSRVPVTSKVVFVTVDDGIEKEPAFIQMVRDFQVPLTLCLADTLIRDDYAYFGKLYETGLVSIQNHTLTHPLYMPGMSAASQLDEIAGQQHKLRREYGVTPYIFRPPGGNYNSVTTEMAGQAGIRGMMLWKESMQVYNMQYQTARHRLDPGDIILCHFRGPAQLNGETMVGMMTHLYRRIQRQGFTIADITDYV